MIGMEIIGIEIDILEEVMEIYVLLNWERVKNKM
jgi:hypothetical protein